MEIIHGKQPGAQKVVIYGPEGIGKSTIASEFPKPVFIDTEGSTKLMDVARTPKPTSWTMILEQIRYFKANPSLYSTLIIDTIDWAEQLCIIDVCSKAGKGGIEDFGYGNGYVYEKEEFGKFLNLLQEVVDAGVNVVLTAHAQLRKFEQPDENGGYDRWELKLGKKTTSLISPLVKEWADAVLFANYKTYVVNVDGQGAAKGKNKAQGGSRVMYTTHHPCWDAKNRYGLKDEVPFSFSEIAAFIPGGNSIAQKPPQAPAPAPTVSQTQPVQEAKAEMPTVQNTEPIYPPPTEKPAAPSVSIPEDIPKPLADLMLEHNVSVDEIQTAVSLRGYYPADTPIQKYDPSFINGVLVGAWQQVYKMIQDNNKIPF